jgi:putative hydrolase of the HAD superfamily
MNKTENNGTMNLLPSEYELTKPHPKYCNIIFDLGAVLIYFNAKEIINDLFKQDEPKPYELFEAMKTNLCLDWDRGLRTPHEIADLLADRYNKEKLKRFLTAIPRYLRPLDHGLELFQTIRQKGYKTYALSNITRECHASIAHHEFFKDFNGTVLSYQVKAAKPDPAIYQHLLDHYSLHAHECLFIDDLPENIAGAQAMGIDGIVLKSHEQVITELRALKVL